MLTHGNILANVAGAHAVLETLGLGDDEVFLSFLPLSHAYEHTAGQFLPIAVGAQIYYADGLEALASNFVEVRPTIIACVPRLYEVMRQRILRMTARQPGLKAKLFAKTVELGSKAYERPRRWAWPNGCSIGCSTSWCAMPCGRASAAGSRRWCPAARR